MPALPATPATPAAFTVAADALPAPTPAATVVRFHGETTDGRAVIYPDAARGRTLVLIVGFTQKSATAVSRWSDELQPVVGTRAEIVGVADLDQVPGFIRGYVKRAIDKDVGPPQAGKPSLVTTFDGALRATAPQGDATEPVVYLFRPDGTVVSIARETYTPDRAASLEHQIP
jgi:hypothetical protein